MRMKGMDVMDRYGYVFPYDKIKKGSQIIIWGAGEVGRQYWYQIEQTEYCEVIAFIDKGVRDENRLMEVKPVESLIDYTVDYVLLAISDSEKRKEARMYMDEYYPYLRCVESGHYGDTSLIDLSSAE